MTAKASMPGVPLLTFVADKGLIKYGCQQNGKSVRRLRLSTPELDANAGRGGTDAAMGTNQQPRL